MRVSEIPQTHCEQHVVCLVYTVAVRSQSTHHFCSDSAIATLTTGSNPQSTGSTNFRVTIQHKSGT